MNPLFNIKNITKKYEGKAAVNGVCFSIFPGEVCALVGQSGSGKSTIGKMLLGLIEPTSGKILYKGEDIFSFSKKQWKAFRHKVQVVFQDPYSSLNPRMTIEEIIAEPLIIHGLYHKSGVARILELLALVGLSEDFASRYPHELSGGQRQRVGIARALALCPEFLVCDEPISALDLSVQAQIINLLLDLKKKLNLTLLFISHDLNIVRFISDRVAVLHQGEIVEIEDVATLFNQPKHIFTRKLLEINNL